MSLATAPPIAPAELTDWLRDSAGRLRQLVGGLDEDQLIGPQLDIVNPLRWEVGHVAWFFEYFTLRDEGRQPSLRGDADALYDSMGVAHDDRWSLQLPSIDETLAYLDQTVNVIAERLATAPDDWTAHTTLLGVYHADMHAEAFTYTYQTHGWPRPDLGADRLRPATEAGPLPGDVSVPGGTYLLGARDTGEFTFDCEQWAHPVELADFQIARAPVTRAEWAAFVDAGGYTTDALWSPAGLAWRQRNDVTGPLYWRRSEAAELGWERRSFDRWVPLEPHRPVIHVSYFEAEAFCAWAGRRLPTEAEWEKAAGGDAKPRQPWGDQPIAAAHASTDWRHDDAPDVAALPAGDGAFGCRQQMGGVWEWTSSDFLPFPGFRVGIYRDYSAPWFGTRKVLRGGAWTTPARMLWTTWRNYFTPNRRDVFAGVRTCAR